MKIDDSINLETYLRLFEPYQEQLKQFDGREGEYGARFALLFRQVLRLLISPAQFNHRVPRTFIRVAQQYLDRDLDTVRHFTYEDNRHFFLCDLLEWLRIQERGQKMKQMGDGS
ncbi:MAG: hypothetical protein AB2807_02435 [Candidatus Sedimenticola endophacoides]